jgi:hypothetical protein
MNLTQQALATFRATRKSGIESELLPSDEPASEEYSYQWGGMTWVIRCEHGRYVYTWMHPCNEDAPTLAEAENLLLEWAIAELS